MIFEAVHRFNMFSKLLVAAFVGMALAGQDEDAIAISKKQALTSSFTSRLAARLAAAQVNHGMLKVRKTKNWPPRKVISLVTHTPRLCVCRFVAMHAIWAT
jgi:hypothetical protein